MLVMPSLQKRPMLLAIALLALFQLACVTDDDGFDSDDDAVADDDSPQGAVPATDSTPPVALAAADPTSGTIPQSVSFSSIGSHAAAGISKQVWDFGDGHTAEGGEVTHTYLISGPAVATFTITDAWGRQDQATLALKLDPGACPVGGEVLSAGNVVNEDLNEVSGVVESRQNTGVLWVHNDSGDSPRLFALGTDGRHLGTYTLEGAATGDWEDLAIFRHRDSGEWILAIGDIGDNPGTRDFIRVYLVPEPTVSIQQDPVDETFSGIEIQLDYPEEASLNSETLLVDPVTNDLIVVTKTYYGYAGVFRKAAPHTDLERVEMEQVVDLDFAAEPLAGAATTGGEFSPAGDRVVIRTYGTAAYVWLWDRTNTLAEALTAAPCTIEMTAEQQAESIAFAANGQGLWSVSEGAEQPVNYVPFE